MTEVLPELRLEMLDRSNWRRALAVRTAPGQLKFVADYEPVALVILSKCYLRPGGLLWEPLGIFSGDEAVGIAALTWDADTCRLYHLVIDRGWQRRGAGMAALELILAYVWESAPDCQSVTLTMHPRNEAARALYKKAGFEATGEERDGEELWHLTLPT